MKTLWLCLTLAGTVSAADNPAPPRRGIQELHASFVEAVDNSQKQAVLAQIAITPPENLAEVRWLFDLFVRFPDPTVRAAVMASTNLLDQKNIGLEQSFIEYLKLPENEAVIFGINGALRLRSQRALPLIIEIAQRKFKVKSPGESPLLSNKNAWWTQYEALSALAQWQGTQALPLIEKKTDEAPGVARLMALYLWKESLPKITEWANAGGRQEEKAHNALTADIPLSALRATRADMLKILKDAKADKELRHQLAIKVGLSSADPDIDDLIGQWKAATDPDTKLMFSTALFASRNARTVPWLKKQAVENLDPKLRMGSLVQLGSMIPAAEHQALVQWTALHDEDEENRRLAADMVKTPAAP